MRLASAFPVSLAVLIVWTFTLPSGPTGSDEQGGDDLVGAASCAVCQSCATASGDGHEDIGAPGYYTLLGHGCFASVGCGGHSSCGGGDEEPYEDQDAEEMALMEHVDRLARDHSADAVLAIINGFPNRVEVNASRTAIQVLGGCETDLVIAHIPLSQEMTAFATSLDGRLAER